MRWHVAFRRLCQVAILVCGVGPVLAAERIGAWAGSGGRSVDLANPLFALTLETPARVTISLDSPLADPFLILLGRPTGLAWDDDSGRGRASRLGVELDAGRHYVIAATYREGSVGRFTLATDFGRLDPCAYTFVYPGLGNHDYSNPVDDCGTELLGTWNLCATAMVEYLVDEVESLNPIAADYRRPENGGLAGSLAYSWDIGDIHFVQLNNYATYRRPWVFGCFLGTFNCVPYDIESSIEWLRGDLESAAARGKSIVLNVHDDRDFRDRFLSPEIEDLLARYPVSAILSGHFHSSIGQVGRIAVDRDFVPRLRSGSAHYGSILVARFTGGTMYVWVLVVDQLDRDGALDRITVRHDDGAGGETSLPTTRRTSSRESSRSAHPPLPAVFRRGATRIRCASSTPTATACPMPETTAPSWRIRISATPMPTDTATSAMPI